MDSVLAVKNLTKQYPNFALQNVTFAIPEGCVAGFIGLNGQGKTTTIRSILGLCVKDTGTVQILGKDMDQEAKAIKQELGVVFDEGYLYDALSIQEMKNIVARAYPRWEEMRFQDFLKRFGLRKEQKIATLSKGMRMKLALALALSHHAKFLILDEPTSGLDPMVRQQLLALLREFMQEEGQGVLYSSHITSDLDQFSDVIIFIDKGKILLAEEKDILLERHRLVKGDPSCLTDTLRQHFLTLKENDYSFSGVTTEASLLKEAMPNVLIERINIEQMMLAYVGEEKPYV
ncbi:ABC transporter ATP-binding protein [Levyella massiliensis]|uniref:ABC transporter ATP-binding protein n=1 Tax=Levyella massiliensis TaxID=938289 RepID=UPI000381C369|nr:ABC transporter ATP-binding protein [Levyella massiliensis]